MMPGMDGIEAVRRIREEIGTDYAKTIPVIALTANAIVGNEDMFLKKGFQAFVSKPIQIDRLDHVVREWVRDEKLEESLEKVTVEGQLLPNIRSGQDRRLIVNRRSSADRRSAGRGIPGLDTEKGIERFGGDRELYLQVLRSYAENTRTLIKKISDVTMESLHDYAIIVHGIRSSSQSICAEWIGSGAEALEKAAKAGNYYYVVSRNGDFIQAVNDLIDNVDQLFKKMPVKKSAARKTKPDRELLVELKSACQSYDMDGVDAAINEIEKFKYTNDDGLVAWLKKNIEETNFTQIIARLLEETDERSP